MEYKFENKIVGDFVDLRKITISDAEDVYSWRKSESGKYLRHPENYTLKTQKEWIKNITESEINYIIYSKDHNNKVGMIGIYDINRIDKIANVGRLFLSDDNLKKSNPYGLESLLLAYDIVFNKMKFRKITGDILGLNDNMIKLQKFLGMKQEGYLEKHVYIKNNYQDLIIMSLFEKDFKVYKNRVNMLLKSFRK
ncbi:MAG: GNAT family N-acetyltransferase [Ignavibacteria bacterium]